jgi:hypothetical protein
MKTLIPGHTYQLDDGTMINFPGLKRDPSTVTTAQEIIQVLIHHLSIQDPVACDENDITREALCIAQEMQGARARRIELANKLA